MIINERNSRSQRVVEVANRMLTAARTSPKAKGVDILECAILTEEDIRTLSDEMLRLHEETGRPVFLRDGNNILKADAIVILATRILPMGLNCAHCGFPTCGDKPRNVPCAFNLIDLGIAIGSAVATASDCRVDTRVMYSVGMAAQRLGLLNPPCTVAGADTCTTAGTSTAADTSTDSAGNNRAESCVAYLGIPLSASSKSPFFDR